MGSAFGVTWCKGDWAISHGKNGYRVRRHGTDSKGSPIVSDQAVMPTLEAAVMYAELKGED